MSKTLQATHVRTAALFGGWLGIVALGMFALGLYGHRPGAISPCPSSWPAESRLARAAGENQLIMFVHPRCPCTRASIHELTRVLTSARQPVATTVAFFAPDGDDSNWHETDLWRSVLNIPGVVATVDPDGTESHLFGARTSGHVVLYDDGDRLVFSGGLTPARGHDGDSHGRQAILDWIRNSESGLSESPVFGCPIAPHGDSCAKGEG